MFQIIFNPVSAAEMAAMPKELQLELLAEFQALPEDWESADKSQFGIVEREGRRLYRCRAKDYRIYFEPCAEGVTIHRVLHKNTLRDFLYRSNLPLDEEDAELAGKSEFWKIIDEGRSGPSQN